MYIDLIRRILPCVLLFLGIMGTFCPFGGLPSSFAADKEILKMVEPGVLVHGGRISIHIQNASLRDVLREISRKTGIEVVPGDGVFGEVSIRLMDVTIEEALEKLCRNRALVFEYLPDVGIYRIVSALAVGDTGETKVSAMASGDSLEFKQALSGAAADRIEGKPEMRASSGESGEDAGDPARPLYKSGELLVRAKPDATAKQLEDLHRSLGSTVIGSLSNLRLQRVGLRGGLTEKAATALYEASGLVEHVERHALRYPNKTSNDPYFNLQWGLANIRAGEAWNITSGTPEVVVAVIDTGVNYRHPDLEANIWINTAEANGVAGVDDDRDGYVDDIRGWDFVGFDASNPIGDNEPLDGDGHGTHIAGIIAAAGNNGLGITGINWRARIMILKVAADNSGYFEDFAIIGALQYAADHGAKIVNCSFGGSSISVEEERAFLALKNRGILAVCAAGNNGLNADLYPNYPANYTLDNIISVAASGPDGQLAPLSNYGPASVDLMAPGVDIYSTTTQASAAGPYEYRTGTSMAVAHVTGVAGLLLAQRPSLSYLEIRNAILSTVDPVGSVAGKIASGGRLNASAALRSLLSPGDVPGDLTGDCRIGLDDAILALQVLSGLPLPNAFPCPACKKDISGDDRTGLEEVIFILQTASDLR